MHSTRSIEGIGPVYSKKLHQCGIDDEEQLLEQCCTSKLRCLLARKSGISEHLILKWVNRADLMRINGIGEEYADLLEHAGVDSVPELAQRNAINLYFSLQQANDGGQYVRRLPSQDAVQDWIMQAQRLPQIISY